MLARLRAQQGFGIVEMIVAMVVLTVALLALAAAYDEIFSSLHSSARKSAATNLAEQQLELYSSIPFASLGFNPTVLANVKAADSTYSADDAALSPSGTDLTTDPVTGGTTTCSTTTATDYCRPVQCKQEGQSCTYPVTTSNDPVGSDNRHYKVETFIRTVTQSTSEVMVTVIVRDPNETNSPIVYQASTAFDCGPACP
jgi:prepilin-type N-terminal cleavage/methylation domain-containing protein